MNKPSDCIYPDYEGGYFVGEHVWDKEGFCRVCGATVREAYPWRPPQAMVENDRRAMELAKE